MSKNKNLNRAKVAKNDEFYTQLSDIEKELYHYRDQFKDKVIFMNCDDPKESNFWKYFYLNYQFLGIKKLISTHYDENESTYKLEYGYDEDGQLEIIETPLEGNGDFRSAECIELLKEADLVITNPPFSLFRDYVAQLIEYDKDFIIIGSKNAITYKEIFPLIKDNKMWLGINSGNGTMHFMQPDTDELKSVASYWYTNMPHSKRNEELILWQSYDPENNPKYDNYDAIEVSKVKEIPKDYYGVMGVPITFLNNYNPNQFEILGLTTGRSEFSEESYPTKRYVNAIQHNKNGTTTSGSKANTRSTLLHKEIPNKSVYYTADNADGYLTIVYARILIKRKDRNK